MLILSTFFNIINHFYKKSLSHSYVVKMYEQKTFLEHIFVDEIHCNIEMRFSNLRIYEQFIRISKFFVIDIPFEQSFKSMWYWIKCLLSKRWAQFHRKIQNQYLSRIDRNFFTLMNRFIFCKTKNLKNFTKIMKNWLKLETA